MVCCGPNLAQTPAPEYTSELIGSKSPPSKGSCLKRLCCDISLGLFEALILYTVWYYDEPIDVPALKARSWNL